MNQEKQDTTGPTGNGSADLAALRAELTGEQLEPGDQAESGERYSFGDAPGNRIPVEWAQELLYRLHKRDPDAFGIELMEMVQERTLGRTDLAIGKRRNRKPRGE